MEKYPENKENDPIEFSQEVRLFEVRFSRNEQPKVHLESRFELKERQ